MKRILTVTFIIGAYLAFSPLAYAKVGGQGFHKKIMKELNLSEEQKSQMKDLRKKNKTAMQELREKTRAAREKLELAFSNGASDQQLTQLHAEVINARNAMGAMRFGNMLAMRKLLNEDQKKTFDTLKAEKKKMRRERRQQRRNEVE